MDIAVKIELADGAVLGGWAFYDASTRKVELSDELQGKLAQRAVESLVPGHPLVKQVTARIRGREWVLESENDNFYLPEPTLNDLVADFFATQKRYEEMDAQRTAAGLPSLASERKAVLVRIIKAYDALVEFRSRSGVRTELAASREIERIQETLEKIRRIHGWNVRLEGDLSPALTMLAKPEEEKAEIANRDQLDWMVQNGRLKRNLQRTLNEYEKLGGIVHRTAISPVNTAIKIDFETYQRKITQVIEEHNLPQDVYEPNPNYKVRGPRGYEIGFADNIAAEIIVKALRDSAYPVTKNETNVISLFGKLPYLEEKRELLVSEGWFEPEAQDDELTP